MASEPTTDQNVPAANTRRLAVAPQENTQPPRRRRPRGVTVPEEIIRPLNEHYVKLEGYIKGFLMFRELSAKGTQIRSALYDANRWKASWTVLDEVRKGIEDIEADFMTRDPWQAEFEQQLAEFGDALAAADAFLNAEDGPFSDQEPDQQRTLAGMSGPVTRMIKSANAVERQCRTSSQEELDELGRYVKNIFDQLQRRATEVSGSNEPASLPSAASEERSRPTVEFGRLGSEERNVPGRSVRREASNGN